jgi:hypothetical protein
MKLYIFLIAIFSMVVVNSTHTMYESENYLNESGSSSGEVKILALAGCVKDQVIRPKQITRTQSCDFNKDNPDKDLLLDNALKIPSPRSVVSPRKETRERAGSLSRWIQPVIDADDSK